MGILAIPFFILGLFITYLIIKWAIDGSETAQNIRDIRRILIKQYPVNNRVEPADKGLNEDKDRLDFPIDECPACHSKIQDTCEECASCGLKIRNV